MSIIFRESVIQITRLILAGPKEHLVYSNWPSYKIPGKFWLRTASSHYTIPALLKLNVSAIHLIKTIKTWKRTQSRSGIKDMIHVTAVFRIQETKRVLTLCFSVQHHHYESPRLPCKELRRKAQGNTAGAESTELRGEKMNKSFQIQTSYGWIIILTVFKELTKV